MIGISYFGAFRSFGIISNNSYFNIFLELLIHTDHIPKEKVALVIYVVT